MIHHQQNISSNFVYTGSAFNLEKDTSKKSLLLVELNDSDKPTITHVYLNLLSHKTITVNSIEEIDDDIIPADSNEKIILNVMCNENDFKKFKKNSVYKNLIEHGVKVYPIVVKTNIDIEENKFENEDRKSFKQLMDESLEDESNIEMKNEYCKIMFEKEIIEQEIEFE